MIPDLLLKETGLWRHAGRAGQKTQELEKEIWTMRFSRRDGPGKLLNQPWKRKVVRWDGETSEPVMETEGDEVGLRKPWVSNGGHARS